MRKPRLMTPGPAPVPEEVLLELARPLNHHRSGEAKQQLDKVHEGLRTVFQTRNDVLVLTCSGTGSMEAALVNSAPPGSSVLVLDAGHFANRWGRIAEAFGIQPIPIETAWGEPVDPTQVAQALDQNPKVAAVCATLCETSTGTTHPIAAIGQIVRDRSPLFLVDGISGVGAIECRTDAWGIDILCVGSQKALMLPPGLAFLAVSPRAWARIDAFEPRSFYFNLKAARAAMGRSDTPWTPAHSLIRALGQSLQRILEEGIEAVWARHGRMGRACRAGIQALGLELFSSSPADAMTVFRLPEDLRDTEVRGMLNQRFGITIVGGQGRLQGQVLRVGHLGYMDELDVIAGLAAIEQVLHDLGWPLEPGVAVAAAQRVLLGTKSSPDTGPA